MAIKNQDGNYLKIVDVNIMYNENNSNINIRSEIFQSEEKRVSGLTSFETTEIAIDVLDNFEFDENTKPTFNENLLTNAYLSLKATDKYSTWIDC